MAKYLNTEGLTHLIELIKNGMSPKDHKHSTTDITSGTLPIANGGTGASTSEEARTNLGITPENIGAIKEPATGIEGQVLTKTADGSEWQDSPNGLPDGGTDGQVLTYGTAGATWEDLPEIMNADEIRELINAPAIEVVEEGKAVLKTPNEAQVATLAIEGGGTGATTVDDARTALGAASINHNHTVDNITGLQDQLDGKAASSHNHDAADIASGTLSTDRLPTVPITKGGTGATTVEDAREALGIKPALAGMIYPYAGENPPIGFLLCDGQAVSRTQYSALFDVIGTTYGEGDGTTTFNVPNLQTRVAVGSDGDSYPLGGNGGSSIHNHFYKVSTGEYYADLVGAAYVYDYDSEQWIDRMRDGTLAASTAVNNNNANSFKTAASAPFRYSSEGATSSAGSYPPYLVLNYIISIGDTVSMETEGEISYPVAINYGGTGASTVEQARENLEFNKSANGGVFVAARSGLENQRITDLGRYALYDKAPGTYLVDKNAANAPSGETGIANLLVSYVADNRMIAILVYDNGHIYIPTGFKSGDSDGAWNWKRVYHSGETVPVANGGTGGTTPNTALKHLGMNYRIYTISKIFNSLGSESVWTFMSSSEITALIGRTYSVITDMVSITLQNWQVATGFRPVAVLREDNGNLNMATGHPDFMTSTGAVRVNAVFFVKI